MTCVRIEMADNGFTLEYSDPEIVAKNSRSDSYTDPSRSRVYSTADALLADLKSVLPVLKENAAKQDDDAVYKSTLDEAFAKV